jgi:hypothetical protein
MPDGGWVANENRFDALSWGAVFVDELMPEITGNYAVATDAAHTAIGGISRGGFWAFHIGFSHPDRFSAIGGHSAFLDRFHAPPSANPLDLAQNAAGVEQLRIRLDRGTRDFAAEGMDLLDNYLRRRDIDHEYVLYAGESHDNSQWSAHLDDYLAFYAASWVSPQRAVPTAAPSAAASPAPGLTVYLPVVARASLQTSLPAGVLADVARGEAPAALVLDETTAGELSDLGLEFKGTFSVVPDVELDAWLLRDPARFSLLPLSRVTLAQRILWVDDRLPLLDLAGYPLQFAGGLYPLLPESLTTIMLSGVTALTRNTHTALEANGTTWAGEAIAPWVTATDFFHTSNEVSVVDGCPAVAASATGGPGGFCGSPEHLDLLTMLDVDVVELTGNHNNDFGYGPYLDTLAWYRERGIATVGGGETVAMARQPLLIDHNGHRIAWFACNAAGPYYALANDDPSLLGGVRPGAAACDQAWLNDVLQIASASYDLVILTVQQVEYEQYVPTDDQRFQFRRYADLGADVVVGTAAHKPQIAESYMTRRGEVAYLRYGLGNLFFDQPFWGNSRFFMDTLILYDGLLRTVDVFPGIIEDLARPRLMTDDERLNFLAFMAAQ